MKNSFLRYAAATVAATALAGVLVGCGSQQRCTDSSDHLQYR